MKKFAPFAACALLLAACSDSAGGNSDGDEAADKPSEETSSEWPTGDGSTPEEPLPADETVSIEDYDITIVETNVDATDEILEADPENQPPDEHVQFVMSTIEVTFTDGPAETPMFDFAVVAADRDEFTALGAKCGTVPDFIGTQDISETDDSVTGNICTEVSKSAIDGATWRFEAGSSEADPVFIRLQ